MILYIIIKCLPLKRLYNLYHNIHIGYQVASRVIALVP